MGNFRVVVLLAILAVVVNLLEVEARSERRRPKPVINKAGRVCNLPKDPGPCRGYQQRWYFNKDTSKCTVFGYGGCQGNQNRFNSETQCRRACAQWIMIDEPTK